jgi:CelD/BcsL family acetyltransferase involved in cellulose biosynthesis
VPVGHGDYDYHDPVLSNVGEDIGDEFWNVYLEQLEQAATGRYDFVAINGIRGTFNSGRWQSDDVAPFISVSSATDVLAQLKRSLRGDIRRQRRRLEEVGMLSLKTFSSSEIDPALVVLAEFLEAHSTRWPNSFRVPTLHERLVEYGLHAGVAHFSVLNLDGEPISWHLGFNDARRFYWYMPVYKEQYAAFSPGKLHLAAFVETAHATGARTVDLLRGDESYKSDWATGNEALHCTSRWSGSPTSRIRKCLLTTGKPLVQRMKRLIAPDSGTSPTAVDMELARRANLHAPLSAPNSLW